MQIDRHNFSQQLPALQKNIALSDFISFDCQFSGLVTQIEQRIEGEFPDYVQFYERMKETAYNFGLLQLGLTTYVFNKDSQKYIATVYNIYILPRMLGHKLNNILICQVSSLQFLANNGMDFKKVFTKGIEIKRIIKKQQQQQHQLKKQCKQNNNNNEKRQFFSEKDKKIIQKLQQQIQQQIIKQKKQKKINFLEKSILTYFKLKYPLINFNRNNKMQNYQFFIKLSNIKSNEQQKLQYKKQKFIHQNIITNQLTLQIIISTIIQHKKTIVGHFLTLDLALIYHNFIAQLPQKYQQFCKQINKIFPYIFDTKVISIAIQNKLKNLHGNLSGLFLACNNPNILQKYCNVQGKYWQLYKNQNKCHQAGFDSFMTGCIFLAMTNYSCKQYQGSINLEKIQFYNKIMYSRYTKHVALISPNYCQNTEIFANRIVIMEGTKQQNTNWLKMTEILSQYESLQVYQDHHELYFVFNKQVNIKAIIQKYPQLKNYYSRKIIKAHNMYNHK